MICRDAAFWDRIATHPEVTPFIFMGREPSSLGPLVENVAVRPYAATHGGLIFTPSDQVGLVVELHTLFTPEGWGREVAVFAKAVFAEVFRAASLVLTYEQEGHWRSRPPRSHGWTPCGEFTDCGFPRRLKLWSLSREAFLASPVGRKMEASECL